MTIGSAGPGNGGTMRLGVGSLRVTERKETRRASALDPSRRFRAVVRMSIGGPVGGGVGVVGVVSVGVCGGVDLVVVGGREGRGATAVAHDGLCWGCGVSVVDER